MLTSRPLCAILLLGCVILLTDMSSARKSTKDRLPKDLVAYPCHVPRTLSAEQPVTAFATVPDSAVYLCFVTPRGFLTTAQLGEQAYSYVYVQDTKKALVSMEKGVDISAPVPVLPLSPPFPNSRLLVMYDKPESEVSPPSDSPLVQELFVVDFNVQPPLRTPAKHKSQLAEPEMMKFIKNTCKNRSLASCVLDSDYAAQEPELRAQLWRFMLSTNIYEVHATSSMNLETLFEYVDHFVEKHLNFDEETTKFTVKDSGSSPKWLEEVVKDVNRVTIDRTRPTAAQFKLLMRVLTAYGLLDHDIRYAQGMSRLALIAMYVETATSAKTKSQTLMEFLTASSQPDGLKDLPEVPAEPVSVILGEVNEDATHRVFRLFLALMITPNLALRSYYTSWDNKERDVYILKHAIQDEHTPFKSLKKQLVSAAKPSADPSQYMSNLIAIVDPWMQSLFLQLFPLPETVRLLDALLVGALGTSVSDWSVKLAGSMVHTLTKDADFDKTSILEILSKFPTVDVQTLLAHAPSMPSYDSLSLLRKAKMLTQTWDPEKRGKAKKWSLF